MDRGAATDFEFASKGSSHRLEQKAELYLSRAYIINPENMFAVMPSETPVEMSKTVKDLKEQLEEERRRREEAEAMCEQREEEIRGLSVNMERLEQDCARKEGSLLESRSELRAVTLRLEAVQQAQAAKGDGTDEDWSNQLAEIFLLKGEVEKLTVSSDVYKHRLSAMLKACLDWFMSG